VTRIARFAWVRRHVVLSIVFLAIVAAWISVLRSASRAQVLRDGSRPKRTRAGPRHFNKGQISRELVRDGVARIYWARVFAFRMAVNASQSDADLAWNKFSEASEEWNANLMLNIQALDEHYPRTGKREQFEFEIQSRWLGISQLVFDLRYSTPAEKEAKQRLIDDIQARTDTLNSVLYEFVLGEPSPQRGR
jgi:hypothetical protein